MKQLRRHVSPGLVVAIAALVVALAGTSVALPGRNSIDKGDLKKGAVKTRAIGKKAVKASKLAPGAVTKSKLAGGAVGAGALGTINTRTATVTIDSGGTPYAETTANCQSGEKLISGGASVNDQMVSEYVHVMESHKQGNGWHARAYNGFGVDRVLTVEAYCLAP